MSQEKLVTSCFPASAQLLRISIHKQRLAHLPHTRSAIQTRLLVLVNMQFKALTVLALSALAIASPELKKRQSPSTTENPTEASVLSVLETALPASLLAIGIANPDELASLIASSLSAGQTPAWYSALPPDVKSYLPTLLSEEASAATVSTPLSNTASISGIISPSLNTTTISSVHSASLKATTTAAGSTAGSAAATASSAHASSTGGASYPSAVVGAGVAGALGLLGMLAL